MGNSPDDQRKSNDFSRFRVPVGSLIVDASLVAALSWWGATMQTRFEESRQHDEAVHLAFQNQIARIESQVQSDTDGGRLTALEQRIVVNERDRLELKADINSRLERIEDKLDRALR